MSLRDNKSKNIDKIYGSVYVYNDDKDDWVRINSPEIGDVKFSVKSINHNGWLLCDGSAISRTLYLDLYNVIGTSFGSGNGTTTFNLPDSRSRVLGSVGAGAGLTTRSLGASVGAETHTLTEAEIPSHTHSVGSIPDGTQNIAAASGGGTTAADEVRTTITSGSAGGGGAHNNMQPTLFIGNVFIFGQHQI